MSGFAEWCRKLGHRLCKSQVPDKFLLPQLAGTLETADARLFKKLVQKGRLAPFYPGHDEPTPNADVTECPICCMYYRVMNKTRCCGQRICSECIVQIRVGCPYNGSTCPFCKRSGLDVEISEGKTETEREADLLDEQRFQECRIRQLAEADSGHALLPTPTETPPSEQEPPQTLETASPDNPEPDLGDSSSSHYNLPTPRSVEDEYRQEYAAMSRHTHAPSNLSNSELQQCEDYLGVCPEDLGLRLEEFNDLLLEQTLISSMIEMRRAEKQSPQEAVSEAVSDPPQPQGEASSSAVHEQGLEAPEGPDLRSHSVSADHPSTDEDSSPQRSDAEGGWTLERVLRQVAGSAPLSFLTVRSGEPSSSVYAPTPPSPFSPQQSTEGVGGQTEEPDQERDDRRRPSEVWKNLLNSLAGFDNGFAEFRMFTVKFDDPNIDAVFNRRLQDMEPDSSRSVEMAQQEEVPEAAVVQEMPVAQERATKPMAVQNPDGSIAIVSVPNEPVNRRDVTGGSGEDRAVISATAAADRSQRDAIESADARLRELYRRS